VKNTNSLRYIREKTLTASSNKPSLRQTLDRIGDLVPKNSVMYILYLDHVLYRNTPKPVEKPVECETVGWLTSETKEVMHIENDRTLDKLPYSSGRGSGFVILKSCIKEIWSPLQKISDWHLIYRKNDTKDAESAPKTTKRKIQPQ